VAATVSCSTCRLGSQTFASRSTIAQCRSSARSAPLWNDAVTAGWSVNPLGMLWPEMDVAFGPGDRLQRDIAGT
jgi:hypothetical protein